MRSVVLALALVAAAASCAASPAPSGSGGSGNGGTTAKGGTTGTGGKTGSGGATSKGGTTGSGGTSASTGPVDCTDTSNYSNSVTGQYGATTITADNDSTKSYYMQANWWGSPYNNQTEAVKGLGFTIANPNNSVPTSTPSNPLGFPSIFIGTYGSKRSTGSNLPKAVSSLTNVWTIFSTNVDTMSTAAGYNATYDVWFTATSAVVSGSTPGPGGAYLMVWLFKPTDKQPRGTVVANGSVVSGVKGGWDVWYDPGDPNINPPNSSSYPCVSYVHSGTAISSLEFDLNNFIQDAIQSKWGVTSSQYLSIVFAGFEVWQGGDGLQMKQFCANVK